VPYSQLEPALFNKYLRREIILQIGVALIDNNADYVLIFFLSLFINDVFLHILLPSFSSYSNNYPRDG
jgi:hypothetical protein